jgi:hypothetical protein
MGDPHPPPGSNEMRISKRAAKKEFIRNIIIRVPHLFFNGQLPHKL